MDARQLKYFLAVAEHRGFTRAAEHLLMSQPSLSQSIALLERELQVALFHRVGRKAVLTAAGEQLVGHARVVLRDLEEAKSAIESMRGLRSGRLDVVTLPSPGVEPISSLVSAFTARHPAVSLKIDGAFSSEEVVDKVRAGSSEVGILGERSPFRMTGVNTLQLEKQPVILVVNPKQDNFGSTDRIQVQDLAGERLIVSQTGLMRSIVDEALAKGLDAFVVVEAAHRPSMINMVLSGVGHAVMTSAWASFAHQLGLRTLVFDPLTELHVALISRQDHLTPLAQEFLRVAAEYASHGKPIGSSYRAHPV